MHTVQVDHSIDGRCYHWFFFFKITGHAPWIRFPCATGNNNAFNLETHTLITSFFIIFVKYVATFGLPFYVLPTKVILMCNKTEKISHG